MVVEMCYNYKYFKSNGTIVTNSIAKYSIWKKLAQETKLHPKTNVCVFALIFAVYIFVKCQNNQRMN